MRIVLFGAPGSGKGTQGDLIVHRYGVPRISTGDLLRLAVAKGTPLGRKAESLMNTGRLVSDDVVIELVRERIAEPDCRTGYILDGFPRTIAQADAVAVLDGARPEVVIGIEVRPEVLVDRLCSRRTCASCQAVYNVRVKPPATEGRCDVCGGPLVERKDDTPKVIRERIRIYNELTSPLKDYYRRRNVYHAVDGERTIDEIFGDIARLLDGILGRRMASERRP
jgi:adenylate kinase